MDLAKAFGFVFEDEQWLKKLLIGGVVSLVPILNLAAVGYMLRTLRNVAAGEERPLPEWDDLGGDWVKGLVATVAGFVYALPILVLMVPLMVLAALADQNGGEAGGTLAVMGVWCVVLPFSLLLSAWIPAATARYAVDGDFAAFFRFGEIWGLIRRNLGNYLIALLVYMVVASIASTVGIIACVIGVAFTSFWSMLLLAHLLGQIVLRDRSGLAPAPAL